MEIPKIQVIVKDDAESSTYRFAKAKKSYNFKEIQKVLVATYGVEIEDVTGMVLYAYNSSVDAISGATAEYFIPKLGDDVFDLFKFFRWHSSEDGTGSVYVQTGPNMTFVLTVDPMKTASALPCGEGSLEDYMIEEYLRIAKRGKLPFINNAQKNDNGEVKTGPTILPTLAEYWETHIKKIWETDSRFRLPHRPVEISTDSNKPSFFFWDRERIKPGPHPNWDKWMEVMPEYAKKVFRAWIASILDPMNKGRQALWLQDPGYSGKSTVIRVISKFLGTAAVGSISQGSLGDKFSYSSLYGKRLVVYGDNKNPKLLHLEKVHSLLGGDIVSIERKNVQPFSAPIHARLLIAANCLPEVDLAARSEITRILPISLQEPPEHILASYCKTDGKGKVVRQKDGTPIYIGGDLEGQLAPEMPFFLYTCQQDYEELCPNRMDIMMPEEMWEALNSTCSSPEHTNLERFVEEELEFHESYSLKPGDLLEVFNSWNKGKANQFDYARLKTYIITKENCKETRQSKGPRLFKGLRLKAATAPGGIKA